MCKASCEHGLSLDLVSGVRLSCFEMFDWEDQEVANILWGEADDHIVTYPEESEKKSQPIREDHDTTEANKDTTNSKPSEQMSAATKTKLKGHKLERNDELSLLASDSDLNSIGKKIDPDKGPEISENQNEDEGLGDILSNSWANIENFHDLDHIFSNEELVNPASLDSTYEFWASSGDMLDNTVKSSSLALDSTSWGLETTGNPSDQFDFNSEYLYTGKQSYCPTYEKEADSACYSPKMLHSRCDEEEIDVTTVPNLISEKTAAGMNGKNVSEPKIADRKISSTNKPSNLSNWARPQSKHELKSQKINSHSQLRDVHRTWEPVLDHQKMPQQSTCLAYQQFSNPYVATYPYGNISEQTTVIKSQKMTPQEKIEKLRRRQQMRAMLAIQKQQQQFNHAVPVPQNSSQEDFKGEENIVPTYDRGSPLKQDDSSTSISVEVDEQNVEETVLYQLQDTVAKLDMNVRLGVRDSLFRLAQSAMQRHSTNDSTNIVDDLTSNQESFMRIPSVETETNEIDRAVAHLLFHRPTKSSLKHVGTPESSISTKIPPDNVQNIPSHGSTTPRALKQDLSEKSAENLTTDQKMKQKMVESAD